jgi:hypothetical protein
LLAGKFGGQGLFIVDLELEKIVGVGPVGPLAEVGVSITIGLNESSVPSLWLSVSIPSEMVELWITQYIKNRVVGDSFFCSLKVSPGKGGNTYPVAPC